MRTVTEIKRELEELAERRAALWHELSVAPNAEIKAEIARLNDRIEKLWSEAREARTRARYGPQEAIVKRARAEERLDRELGKVA